MPARVPATFNFVQVNAAETNRKVKQYQDNLTRPATVELNYTATGTGQKRIGRIIEFPVAFVQEPHFVTGCGTIKMPDTNKYNDPIGTAGVYQWKMDKARRIIGAFIWVRVELYPVIRRGGGFAKISSDMATLAVDLKPNQLQTMIFMTFSGKAIKDPSTPDAYTLKPRSVNL